MLDLVNGFRNPAGTLRTPLRSRRSIARGPCLSAAILVGLIGLVGTKAVGSNDASPVLARVNGEVLTVLDLDALLATHRRPTLVEEIPPVLQPDGLLERLVQNRLIEQEGYRIEADRKPEIRNQVWDLKRHKGMMALLDSVSRTAYQADESAIVNALQQTNTILRVSHILLESKEAIEAMIDSIEAGTPFADLADRHSQDTTSVIEAGGDLGWAREDLFIPEFAAALEGLSPGEHSAPVKSERGWHLLQLVDMRTETVGQSDEMETAVRDAAKGDRVMKAVRSYVASLFEKYDAEVDSTLLASLDYGSEDPKVQTGLQTNDAVLVRFPWRELTVRDLSQEIRFQHFHGIVGKPNAAQMRDKAFDEWTTQLLLRHEASVLGFDKRPLLLVEAEALERRLVGQEVLNMVLDVKFAPTEDEIVAYHEAHKEDYTSAPRFRAKGILLSDESVARTVRSMLGDGARMSWLASNTPEVVDKNPEVLSGWMESTYLGIAADEVRRGAFVGPTRLGDVWAVAEIIEVEPAERLPLAECREKVLQAMKGEKMRASLQSAVEQLEANAEVEVMDDAEEKVRGRLEAWLGRKVDVQ